MKNPLFDSLVWNSLRLTPMNFALGLSGLVPPSAHLKLVFTNFQCVVHLSVHFGVDNFLLNQWTKCHLYTWFCSVI